MKGSAEWPSSFDRDDNHAAGQHTPLENLSAQFTPGHSFTKDPGVDPFALTVMGVEYEDHTRLVRDAFIDGVSAFEQAADEAAAAAADDNVANTIELLPGVLGTESIGWENVRAYGVDPKIEGVLPDSRHQPQNAFPPDFPTIKEFGLPPLSNN